MSTKLGAIHTTSFNGSGLPTRKNLKQVCSAFRYLDPDIYIEQTLDALAGWPSLCTELEIDPNQQRIIQRAFNEIRKRLD